MDWEPRDSEPTDSEPRMDCPHCHRSLEVGISFCYLCGGKLADQADVERLLKNSLGEETYKRNIEAKAALEAEAVRRGRERGGCLHCGSPISVGWNFCGSCGKQVATEEK